MTSTVPQSSTVPALSMQGISKTFPGVRALSDVCLDVCEGEVLALIGENGAGKSTLVKVLGGVHQPDAGVIEINGVAASIESVSAADRLGIGFVHQELNMLDNLDVAGNVFLGREPRRFGLIDRQKIYANTRPYLEMLGLDIDPATPLYSLSIGQQQMVEIAKALSKDARIIIMDEPTSSLTLKETESLLNVIKSLKQRGIAIIYISHRLGEVTECCDRVVALRDGENAGGLAKDEITHDAMVSLMVGRDLGEFYRSDHSRVGEESYFQVKELVTSMYPGRKISFDVGAGEILGVAGLVGAGRSEMAQAIFGVDRAHAGQLTLGGERVPLNSVRSAIKNGIFLAPEDRKRSGIILEFSIQHNISLASLGRYTKAGLIRQSEERAAADQQIKSLNVKAPSAAAIVGNLSGGNQQKVVLGKWLAMNPKVLIFDEPTRGIDVGAKREIYHLMGKLAEEGVAIIVISSDMEEVLGISDRIAVMHEGAIAGILNKEQFSEEAVMHLAVGGEGKSAA
ncbi:MAG: ribose transport system ATP-binding protein [Verrucomicrobiales bacterium]